VIREQTHIFSGREAGGQLWLLSGGLGVCAGGNPPLEGPPLGSLRRWLAPEAGGGGLPLVKEAGVVLLAAPLRGLLHIRGRQDRGALL